MRQSKVTKRMNLLAAVAAILPLVGAVSASGATYYWDPLLTGTTTSGGTGNWDTTTANWYNGTSSDVVWPNTGTDTANFDLASTAIIAVNTTLSAGEVLLPAATQTTITAAAGTKTSPSTSTLDIGTMDVTQHGGFLNFADINAYSSLVVNITGSVLSSSDHSGGWSLNGNTTVNLNLAPTAINNGGWRIYAGTLNVSNAAGFGLGGYYLGGGTLNIGSNITTNATNVRMISNVTFGGGYTLDLTNANSAPTGGFAPNVLAGTTLKLDGNESDVANQTWTLAKSGAGTLILTGKYYAAGNTTVGLYNPTTAEVGGTLQVDGQFLANAASGTNPTFGKSSPFIVNNGTLQGKGTITGTVTIGDTLAGTALGNAVLSAGIGNSLTTGALSFVNNGSTNNAVYSVDINSSTLTSGDVVVNGNLALGNGLASLDITDLGSTVLTGGQVFTILDPAATFATTGYFFGDPTGTNITVGLNTYTISYTGGVNGNAVTLTSVATAIPEPAALGMMAGVGAGLLLIGKRRKVM